MKQVKVRKKIFQISYLIFLFLFTFGIAEISYNMINNSDTQKNKNQNLNYLRNKSIKLTRSITGMLPINKTEIIDFNTDSIGSIYPSSLSNNLELKDYILFCGGSTTEASQVSEGRRPPDIVANISGYKSINIAKAGQDLDKCIQKIDDLFTHIDEKYNSSNVKLPEKIFIATSINSLMEFGRTKSKPNLHVKNKFISFKTPKLFIKSINYKFREIYFSSKLSNYEQALLDGCCYGLAEINSKKTGAKFLDWESPIIEKEYYEYLKSIFSKLDNLAKNYSYNNNDIILVIEPDSFSIDYKKVFRDYWKGIDSRQLMYKYNGKKMNHIESRSVLIKFNKIYSNAGKKYGFKMIEPKAYNFPSYSFYDAVHYTDFGSKFIGEIYANEIKNN